MRKKTNQRKNRLMGKIICHLSKFIFYDKLVCPRHLFTFIRSIKYDRICLSLNKELLESLSVLFLMESGTIIDLFFVQKNEKGNIVL
jgi:hypothetical protein